MKLIVGLGNPGSKFRKTRHNLGFLVLEQLSSFFEIKLSKKKFNGSYAIGAYNEKPFLLLAPQTYMNLSGECVQPFIKYFHIKQEDTLIIYDDITLPLGQIRYRQEGSSGGHNGMLSLINCLKTNSIQRLRVGVGFDHNTPLDKWVLDNFTIKEEKQITVTTKKIIEGVTAWLEGKEFTYLMNTYNH